ncbi:hypothetical protein [Streptosporangium carneum]|uniref:Uncharacterized protein n=1 Tax=Streptosporangium carneum TaxID=47481 RepID=A0A9W6I4Q4_9ACTN|nr:hypothetical protein [Streptosporangium carneum]GLK11174.1 hypothetical protein GCM10017600_45800 [Streptosporangium carneum]
MPSPSPSQPPPRGCHLGFSAYTPQWVTSAYAVVHGGFPLSVLPALTFRRRRAADPRPARVDA